MQLLLCHLVGDYILQTDWMAANKKSSSFACAVHVAAYIIPFLITPLAWWQLVLIAAQHYLQDRWQFVPWFMAHTQHKGFAQPPMAPWSVIITDNVLHGVWIGLVVMMGVQ